MKQQTNHRHCCKSQSRESNNVINIWCAVVGVEGAFIDHKIRLGGLGMAERAPLSVLNPRFYGSEPKYLVTILIIWIGEHFINENRKFH